MTTHRILTPDVARGIMLLAIAVANSVTVWATNIDNPMVGTHIGIVMNDSLWDKIAIMVGAMFIHVRGLPMFATLLGYGMGMILVREYHRKNPYKRILARRYAALAAMGLIHLMFLFFGDIMFMYGILALHVTMIANRKSREQKRGRHPQKGYNDDGRRLLRLLLDRQNRQQGTQGLQLFAIYLRCRQLWQRWPRQATKRNGSQLREAPLWQRVRP